MHAVERVESMAVRQGQIEQYERDASFLHARDSLGKPINMSDPEPAVIGFRQQHAQQPGIARIVLDEQNMRGGVVHGRVYSLPLAGSTTIPSQKSSIDRTTLMNRSKSTGLVT